MFSSQKDRDQAKDEIINDLTAEADSNEGIAASQDGGITEPPIAPDEDNSWEEEGIKSELQEDKTEPEEVLEAKADEEFHVEESISEGPQAPEEPVAVPNGN
ncbi:MAG: hypothetical protein MUO76_24585, partial [Anaerolineaceae bacterium]|nr:hypothetical protein [Anaerolineaceae bacterium]